MMYKSISLLLAIILLTSCNKNQEKKKLAIKEISIDYDSKNELLISDIYENFELIYLDSTLIRSVEKIIEYEGDLFALCDNNYSFIVKITKNGQSHVILNSIGKSPGEYSSINDFLIDNQTGNIELLDRDQRRIHTYTKEGVYIKSIRYNIWANSFCKINEYEYLIYSGSEDAESGSRIHLFNTKSGKITKHLLKYRIAESKFLNFNDANNFNIFDKEVSFAYAFSDTLYSIIDNELIPKYFINYHNNLPNSLLQKDYDNAYEFIMSIRNTSYCFFNSYIFENSKMLTFNYEHNGKRSVVFYNKETSKVSSPAFVYDDLLFNKKHSEYPEYLKPIGIHKNGYIFQLRSDDFAQYYTKNKLSKEDLSKYEGVDFSPILIIAHLK